MKYIRSTPSDSSLFNGRDSMLLLYSVIFGSGHCDLWSNEQRKDV